MLTIYKASAGSGKTFTLTKKYLILLLGIKHKDSDGNTYYTFNRSRNKHRSILAITFTNKATAEMKERIIQQLSRLSGQGKKSDYTDDLLKLFGCKIDELQKYAKVALNDILFDYHNFNISTIDAFFQQVLRSLALELDQTSDFSVEINQDTVLNEGLHRMMSAFNAGSNKDKVHTKALEEVLLRLMEEKRDNGKSFNIFNRSSDVFNTLAKSTGDIFNEKYKTIANQIDPWLNDPANLTNFVKGLNNEIANTKAAIPAIANDILEKMPQDIIDDLEGRSHKPALKKIAAGNLLTNQQITNKGPKAWADQTSSPLNLLKSGCADKYDVNDARLIKLKSMCHQIMVLTYRLFALEAIKKEVPVYAFMAQVRKYINDYRRENGVVVLADTNTILRDLMEQENEVPFIYEKMAVRLEHFLIDEFQDTSRMQWDNLKPLVLNSLSFDKDNLIIGDEKQAIYRFRNSDSSMLHHGIAEDHKVNKYDIDIEGTTPEQNTNWRSAPEVVNFNNSLFKALAKNLKADGYENVEQSIAKKHADLAGRVCMHPFSKPEKEAITDASDDQPEDTPTTPDDIHTPNRVWRENILDALVERIKKQHENGYPWSDIAVLLNKNSDCSDVVAALQAEGIPVATDNALRIDASPTVRLIISGMRLVYEAIINPAIATKKERRSLVFSNKFEFYYTRDIANNIDPAKALENALAKCVEESDDTEALANFVDEILRLQPSTLVALSDTILRERLLKSPTDTDPQKATSFDLPEGEKPYVAAFNDVIHDYVAINGNDLGGFLRFWENKHKSLSIAGEKNTDMVNVLTIHKSKGLQYACVHIPFANYSVMPDPKHPDTIWITPNDTPGLVWPSSFPGGLRITLNKLMETAIHPMYGCYIKNKADCVADNLNKTYVAFTRAERELDVYYDPNEKESIGSYLFAALRKIYHDTTTVADGVETTIVNPEEYSGYLLLGNDTTPKAKEEEVETPESRITLPAQNAPFYAVTYNKDADGVTHLTAIAPGEIDISQMPIVDDTDDSAQVATLDPADRGDLLHFVMSRIYTPGDVDKIVRKYSHLMTEADANLIKNMFADTKYAKWIDRWFKPGLTALNEVSVVTGHHDKAHVRRIDRLILKDDNTAEIVDYKFTADTDDDGYRIQLEEYANFVRAAYPGITVHAWLWYVDVAEIHQII